MAKRVLLTGAGGLIGRQCIAPLQAAGYEVLALSRGRPVPQGVEAVRADMLEPTGLRAAVSRAGASHLLHLAWHDGPRDRWVSPANLDWAAATLTLVRAFAEAGGQRAVCVGSCAEYDWSFDRLSEDTPLAPATLYGAAKASTGNLLTAGAGAMELSLAWARVFFCFGPGEPKGRLLGDLIQGLKAGTPVDCTDGLQKRDFLHTADIGRALARLVDADVNGPVNVASGIATPVREVIETTARLMGRPELIRLGARPRPETDPASLVADIARLRDTGFRPAFDIEAAIADVLSAEA